MTELNRCAIALVALCGLSAPMHADTIVHTFSGINITTLRTAPGTQNRTTNIPVPLFNVLNTTLNSVTFSVTGTLGQTVSIFGQRANGTQGVTVTINGDSGVSIVTPTLGTISLNPSSYGDTTASCTTGGGRGVQTCQSPTVIGAPIPVVANQVALSGLGAYVGVGTFNTSFLTTASAAVSKSGATTANLNATSAAPRNSANFLGTLVVTYDYAPSIPEPSSVALFGIGIVGLGLLRRKSS